MRNWEGTGVKLSLISDGRTRLTYKNLCAKFVGTFFAASIKLLNIRMFYEISNITSRKKSRKIRYTQPLQIRILLQGTMHVQPFILFESFQCKPISFDK